MSLDYTIVPLPQPWPGKATPAFSRARPQFKTIWTKALRLLEREINYLQGRHVTFAVDVDERAIRQDGQLRADARLRTPAVIVGFDMPDPADRKRMVKMSFPCDRFTYWQENIDAIARALEALRMIDRYGVQQGKQYTGFKALPGAGESTTTMTAHDAAKTLVFFAPEHDIASIIANAEAAGRAIRGAQMKTHPDRGGGAEGFVRVQEAKRVLEAHHGGKR